MSTWTGAVSTNWNDALNWGPGGTGTGIPSATVDAIFSGVVPNPCILGAPRACRALTFVGYTSTVDFATFTLTTANNITFQADQSSRILGSTGILILGAAATITSNTGTWPLNFQITNFGTAAITLAGDMRISGSYLSNGGSRTINGNIMYVGGNMTQGTQNLGSTNFVMDGSGTYSGNGATSLEINTTGTVIVTGAVIFTRRFIVATTGTVTMTAANVTISNTTTVDVNSKTIGNLVHSFSAIQTITYLSDIYCSNFTIGNGASIYNGPGQIYASGNYVFGGASSGSLIVNLIGTGTIGVGTMGLSCVIAATGIYTLAATLTLGTSISFTSATGAVLNTGISTVTVSNGVTISTLGLSWNNITIFASATITINSLFYIVGTLAITSGTTTFSGTAGWNCGTLTCSTASTIIVLQSGVTYTTTVNVIMLGTALAGRITMRSNAPNVSYAIWTLQNPASQSMTYVNGQGIDSRLGMTIYTFGGDILTSLPALNWYNGASQGTKAFTFVS